MVYSFVISPVQLTNSLHLIYLGIMFEEGESVSVTRGVLNDTPTVEVLLWT
jgi:hypothetical protein